VSLLSATLRVKVENAQELAAMLRETFPGALDGNVQDAVQRVAQLMFAEAVRLCPVRTGYLQSTIRLEPRGKWTFLLSARAPYASFVEWGTRFIAPRLFMTRAIELHEWEMMMEVWNATSRTVDEVLH
jgi:hypothetical protein